MNNLKQLRQQAGLSLGDLSKKTGASISLLSKFERGERSVNYKWSKPLATALAVRTEELVGDNVVPVNPVEHIPSWIYLKQFDIDTTDMNRVIPNGSLIYAEQGAALDDKGIYIIRVNDELMVRRLRLTDGPLRFEPDSYSSHAETLYPQGGFTIIGRVRGAVIHI